MGSPVILDTSNPPTSGRQYSSKMALCSSSLSRLLLPLKLRQCVAVREQVLGHMLIRCALQAHACKPGHGAWSGLLGLSNWLV